MSKWVIFDKANGSYFAGVRKPCVWSRKSQAIILTHEQAQFWQRIFRDTVGRNDFFIMRAD
jgi:hypothetical protein